MTITSQPETPILVEEGETSSKWPVGNDDKDLHSTFYGILEALGAYL